MRDFKGGLLPNFQVYMSKHHCAVRVEDADPVPSGCLNGTDYVINVGNNWEEIKFYI